MSIKISFFSLIRQAKKNQNFFQLLTGFLFMTITTLITGTIGQIEPEYVAPCVFLPPSQIHCTGSEITDEVLQTVGHRIAERVTKAHFRTLLIGSTLVKKIERNYFPGLTFENIHIDNNKLLTNIDPEAFIRQSTRHLVIKDNPLLSDIRIFELTNNLGVYQSVEFESNAIKV
jgi:hypothetical protein